MFNWIRRLFGNEQPPTPPRIPVEGLFTFGGSEQIYSMIGTVVEVNIDEVLEKYYRISYRQTITQTSSLWNPIEYLPKLVRQNRIEVLKWKEVSKPVVGELPETQQEHRKLKV